MNNELKIRISGISNGFHEYHFRPTAAELGFGGNFQDEVGVDVELEKASRQILVRVAASATARFECDRCLEQFTAPVSARYTMVYLQDEADKAMFPPEEIQFLTPDTTMIDLTNDVREVVLLSVPLKLLCREDCKGLCPQCGTNLNQKVCQCVPEVDRSRWGKLQNLLNS